MKRTNYYSGLIFIVMLVSCVSKQEPPWISLFDGQSLNNWEVKNGVANYTIENQQIVGRTQLGSPNTFLCTQEMYSNFILEFEVRVDSTINSGVQIRTNSTPDYKKGLVYGYQVEIDPSKRSWSGGIYDEGRRGWIYNLENNPQGRKAFKNGEWNHYRIEAIENRMIVWVNGINTANLEDSMTASGFIGLQVHSIQDSIDIGKEIRWRTLKIITDRPDRYAKTNQVTAALIKTGVN